MMSPAEQKVGAAERRAPRAPRAPRPRRPLPALPAALLLTAIAPVGAAPTVGDVRCYRCGTDEMVVTETDSFGNIMHILPGGINGGQCYLRGQPLFASFDSDVFPGGSREFLAERHVDPAAPAPVAALPATPGGIDSTSGLLMMAQGACPPRYIPADHTDCNTLRLKLFPAIIGAKEQAATACQFKGGAVMCAVGGPEWADAMTLTATPARHVFVRVKEELSYTSGVRIAPSMRGRIISDRTIPVKNAEKRRGRNGKEKSNRMGYEVRFDTLGDALQVLLPEQLEMVTGGEGGGRSDVATYLANVELALEDEHSMESLHDGNPGPFIASRKPTCNNPATPCSEMCKSVVRLPNNRALLYPGMVAVNPHGGTVGLAQPNGSASMPRTAHITMIIAALLGCAVFLGGSYTALFVVGRRRAEVLAQERHPDLVGVVAAPQNQQQDGSREV